MIDETDLKIIHALQMNVMATNKAIAAEVGMSDVGVANRISRLLEDRIISTTVFYDSEEQGLSNYCIFEIKVRNRSVQEVAHELALIDEFQVVARIIGAADISVHMFVYDMAHMERLRSKVSNIAGVHTIDAYLTARLDKFMNNFGTYAMLKSEHGRG